METEGKINNLQNDLNILYSQYDIRDRRIEQYVESLGLEPGLKLREYPRGSRCDISDFIGKTDVLRISTDIIGKELELINAVEAYLKLEYYDSYLKDNLEQVFKKTREDEKVRLKALNLIVDFIVN